MKKMILSAAVFSLLLGFNVKAQTVEVEKTYELSKKSSKGTLMGVDFDGATYKLSYVTKATKKSAKFEIYEFDKDFNFKNKTEDELEFEKAKVKYAGLFKKRGGNKPETYTHKWAKASSTMFGTFQIETFETVYTWDWDAAGYLRTVNAIDKFKPKSEEGNKYRLVSQFTDGATGDLICLVAFQVKFFDSNNTGNVDMADYKLLRINMKGEIIKEKLIDNKYMTALVEARTYSVPDPDNEEDEIVKGSIMIFAPANVGGKKMANLENPNKAEFTFMKVTSDLEIETNKNFVVPVPVWRIDEMIYTDNDANEIYLYGPAAEGKDAYWGDAIGGVKKFKAIQLAKLSKGELQYITSTNLDDMAKNYMAPPSQKKSPEYEGKKFSILSFKVMANNDFIVVGQNYDEGKEGRKYTDVIVFHFDDKGKMKANYGIDKLTKSNESEKIAMPTRMFHGEKDENSYFLMREIDGMGKGNRVLTYGRLAKITLKDKGISDFKLLGGQKNDPEYFLDENFPYLETDQNHTIVFFGADKKGRNIWFSRVKLD